MSRVFAVGDIHGCSLTFDAMLSQIRLCKKDKLILLGDYIDKGPQSNKVLDTIINLLNQGYDVVPLKGNHEKILSLIATSPESFHGLKEYYKTHSLLTRNNNLKRKFVRLLNAMPSAFEYGRFLLTHEPHKGTFTRKINIHGHIIKNLTTIQKNVELFTSMLSLDNGCYVQNTPGLGNLIGLELNHRELFIQPNIDYDGY